MTIGPDPTGRHERRQPPFDRDSGQLRMDVLDDVLGDAALMAVVLDRRGRIVAHNRRWTEAAAARGLSASEAGAGVDYLAVFDAVTGADERGVEAAASGIRSVLHGSARTLTVDYESPGADDRRWSTLRASQLAGPESGALVTHVDISGVRAAEFAVRAHLDELWGVVDPGSDFAFLLDDEGVVVARTWDESRLEQWPLVGEVALDCVHPDDRPRLEAELAELFGEVDRPTTVVFRAKGPDEHGWRHFRATILDMFADPTVGGLVVAVLDLTEHLRASASEQLGSAMSRELPVTAIATDGGGIVLAANAAAVELLGVPVDELLGRRLGEYVAPVAAAAAEELLVALDEGRDWSGELRVRRAGGAEVPVAIWICRSDDPVSGFEQFLYLAIDHSEEHRLRASLLTSAELDPLTGLLNRSSFIREVRDRLDALAPGDAAAVVKISLDRFREINEVHGSAVGDAVLCAVGDALVDWSGGAAVVARAHGDVFAVALDSDRVSATTGDELLAAIEFVRPRPGLALRLSASVGIRLLSSEDRDAGTVMDDALSAVHEAKAAGGGISRTFDDDLRDVLRQRAVLRDELAGAVSAGELVVHYQPIIRMDDGSVVGAEALVRWNHPTAGLLPPDRFIPLAEQTALVHDIGSFVLEDVCANAARWRDLRPEERLGVAVNLSAAQLGDTRLVDRVEDALDRHDLDPALLTVELTESMAMDPSGHGRDQMARLRSLGVRIAIDDFGTGYSSLARLKELPLDVVKVDRSFIGGVAASPEDLLIVSTIVSLADAVGIGVVVEGVEEEVDAQALQHVGCSIGQGFLWSRPVASEVFDRLLTTRFPALVPTGAGVDRTADDVTSTDALRALRHELANPLAVLRMSLGSRDRSGAIPTDVVDAIDRSVQRIGHLIGALDLFDNVDRGTLRPLRSPIDLAALTRTLAADVVADTGRVVDVHAAGPVIADVDGPLFEVVLTNLLTNATKYSSESVPVEVAVWAGADGVHVEVRDRGQGIPAEQLGTVWRKFGRLDHGVPGSGIGLFLARGVVRAHGGELRHRPREGGGSIFSLHLPGSTIP